MNTNLFQHAELQAAADAQINREGVKCEGAEIYARLRSGEITHEDYLVQNGLLVAATLGEYQPKKYRKLGDDAIAYVELRARNLGTRNVEIGKRVGLWVQSVEKTFHENRANHEMLNFYVRVLRDAHPEKADRIQFWAQRFDLVDFPNALFTQAIKTQANDSRDEQFGVKAETRKGRN